jgi:hypothetical protein
MGHTKMNRPIGFGAFVRLSTNISSGVPKVKRVRLAD